MILDFSAPVLIASALVAFVAGCGGAEPPPEGSEVVVSPGTDQPSAAARPACTPGETRTCKQVIAVQDGISSCYVGTQSCTADSTWTDCVKGNAKK
ncbi:MAG: hypothetical protein U0235_29015 [Polyangiaceae bacterium]